MADLQMQGPTPRRHAPDGARAPAAPAAPTVAAGVCSDRLSHWVDHRRADALQGQLQRAVRDRAATRAPAEPLPTPAGSQLQRVFQHKGTKKASVTYDKRSTTLPRIHAAKATDLRTLADDDHDYGALENKLAVEQAMVTHAGRRVRDPVTPLDEAHIGNVTVLDVPGFSGDVRVTFQLDWLQGKHDQTIMLEHSSVAPRTSDGTQVRRTLEQYEEMARAVPTQLATLRLTTILGKAEREVYNFSIMKKMQADGWYYEISAQWQNEVSGGGRHVLVYYHCYPA